MTLTLPKFKQDGTGAVNRDFDEKLKESVSVKDFAGADPTGVGDSTTALTNALTHATDLLIEGTFRITSPITLTKANLRIHARPGSSIVYDGAVGSTWALQFSDVNSLIIDGQLTIDCTTKAGRGLTANCIAGAQLVDISGVTVTNCAHSSPSTAGAFGILIQCNTGTGKVAKVTNCVVSNLTRTTADGVGAVCQGIVVNDFDVMVVENNDVNNILKGNGTVDADGIVVFSQLNGSTYTKCSASIRNNRVRNCEGRFVKNQVRGQCTIEDNYFALDSALSLLTNFSGVDSQVSDTLIQNNTVELLTAWTGGSGMHLFQVQFAVTPDYSGQKIEHKVLNNSVFCAAGMPAFSRVVFADFTNLATNAVTAFAHVEGNVAVGAGGWEGASIGVIGIGVRPPEVAFAAGATANVLIANNRVNTTQFTDAFNNGTNASGAYDFVGKLFLTVIGNYLPRQRGDIAVLRHESNNSFTSSFCVVGNSVGTRGNRVATPFDFAHILGGNSFYVAGESTPARTNAPANYTFGNVERVGARLWTSAATYRYSALADIGAAPTWSRFGNRTESAWTTGTYTTSRTVPNNSTATTTQIADALNTLVADLRLAGFVPTP